MGILFPDYFLLRAFTYGFFICEFSWRAYLEISNVWTVQKLPAEIEVLRMTDNAMEKVKTKLSQETRSNLLAMSLSFCVEVMKWESNYYGFVWDLTGKYIPFITPKILRVMLFAGLDEIFTEALAVTTAQDFKVELEHITWDVIQEAVFALGRTVGYERLGMIGMLIFKEAEELAFFVHSVFQFRSRKLKDLAEFKADAVSTAKPKEMQPSKVTPFKRLGSIQALCAFVGFPENRILFENTLCFPSVKYVNFVYSESIVIPESVIPILTEPQLTSVVLREMAHWVFGHGHRKILIGAATRLVVNYLCTLGYGSPGFISIFRLGPNVHPEVPDVVACRFIGKPLRRLAEGCMNLIESHMETSANEYVCRVWDPNALKAAEEAIWRGIVDHTLYYNELYSAWYTGRLPIVEKLRLIAAHIKLDPKREKKAPTPLQTGTTSTPRYSGLLPVGSAIADSDIFSSELPPSSEPSTTLSQKEPSEEFDVW